MQELVSIKGLDKADVLLTLWNHSQMQGLSFLAFAKELTKEDAKTAITEHTYTDMEGKTRIYFDYFNGKVMKVDLTGDEFDPYLYDRDNGLGAAQRAIDLLYQEVVARRIADGLGVSRELLEHARMVPPTPKIRPSHIDLRIDYRDVDTDARHGWLTHQEISESELTAKDALHRVIDTFYEENPACEIISVTILE